MSRKEPAPSLVSADSADEEYLPVEDEPVSAVAGNRREWRELGDGCYVRRSLPNLDWLDRGAA